ncbi:MAG: zinc metallopeptidase [Eubacteriales bacterium]
MPFFYMDWLYILLVLPAVIFAMIAGVKVNSTFNRYSEQISRRGITGREAAERILASNGLSHIRIERINGKLTDHYDPRAEVIRLSPDVYNGTSTAAIGVAAHEVGHAIQKSENYAPLRIRNAIIPITNVGSKLALPLILLGLILTSVGSQFIWIAYAGVICFGLSTLFQLVTLPTEFDASRRAMRCLESYGILDEDELQGSRKVLTAAAMTYVAALAVSLMQLLRLLIIVGGNRNRR